MNKNSVVHFEMPYDDSARVAKFYEQAFGWGMQNLGAHMGDYITAHTAETDTENMVIAQGAINGGLYKRSLGKPPQCPSVVISVEDITVAMDDVKKAGGEVLGKPVMIPGIGMYVSFNDTEGNRVSLLEANRS